MKANVNGGPPLTASFDKTAQVEELVASNIDFAKRLCRHFCASRGLRVGLDSSELLGAALQGLFEAAVGFDRQRGTKFRAYAYRRIMGDMLDELRGIDYLSRRQRAKVKRFKREFLRLAQELGEDPTLRQVAQRLEVTIEEADDIQQDVGIRIFSLDTYGSGRWVGGELFSGLEVLGSMEPRMIEITLPNDNENKDPVEAREGRELVQKAVMDLPERLRLVIFLYYVEELTLLEIGRMLGVGESRVCQLHTKALTLLRMKIPEPEHPIRVSAANTANSTGKLPTRKPLVRKKYNRRYSPRS